MTVWNPPRETVRIRNGKVVSASAGVCTVTLDGTQNVDGVPVYGSVSPGQGVLVLEQGASLLVLGPGGGMDQTAADARYVNVAGDTMTGNLTVNSTHTLLEAPGTASASIIGRSMGGGGAYFDARTASGAAGGLIMRNAADSKLRWAVYKNSTAESGSNSGSNFAIYAYADDGAFLGTALEIRRSDRQITLHGKLITAANDMSVTGAGIEYPGSNAAGGANRIAFKWGSPNINVSVDNAVSAVCATVSDRRLKSGVAPLEGGLDMVERLRPITFWPLDLDGSVPEGSVQHVGMIADEVEQVLPTAVDRPVGVPDALASINYNEIVPVLVKAVQELSARVAELEVPDG